MRISFHVCRTGGGFELITTQKPLERTALWNRAGSWPPYPDPEFLLVNEFLRGGGLGCVFVYCKGLIERVAGGSLGGI